MASGKELNDSKGKFPDFHPSQGKKPVKAVKSK
jgi:hypothetical protein